MVRKFFEEVQTYKESRTFWYIAVILFLSIFTPLLYVMYGQLVLGQAFGRNVIPDMGLIALFFFVILVWVVVMVILLSVKLQTYVDGDGIHYRPFSGKLEWITISKNELVSFEVRRKRRTIFDSGGLSYYKKHGGKSSYVMLQDGFHLELTLNDQKKVFLGTGRPAEFERAVRKMMENSPVASYGR
jgi:hypothetical protein